MLRAALLRNWHNYRSTNAENGYGQGLDLNNAHLQGTHIIKDFVPVPSSYVAARIMPLIIAGIKQKLCHKPAFCSWRYFWTLDS